MLIWLCNSLLFVFCFFIVFDFDVILGIGDIIREMFGDVLGSGINICCV